MSNFNKLSSATTMRKRDVDHEELRRRSLDRAFPKAAEREEYEAADEGGKLLMLTEKMLEAIAGPEFLSKRAALAQVRVEAAALWAQAEKVKAEFAALQIEVDALVKRRKEDSHKVFWRAPFALDANDPRAIEIIGEAVRRNPGLLDKINKPH